MCNQVYIIEDEAAVRQSTELLLKNKGFDVDVFPLASEFLDFYNPNMSGCIVLDVNMPGMSGITLHEKLKKLDCDLPIIFITGYGDIKMAVDVMQAGAVDFLTKPFRSEELVDKISNTLKSEKIRLKKQKEIQSIMQKVKLLTSREKEVLEKIVGGLANKVIAIDLNISERTVEVHRSKIMQKMNVKNLAMLVKDFMKYTAETTH